MTPFSRRLAGMRNHLAALVATLALGASSISMAEADPSAAQSDALDPVALSRHFDELYRSESSKGRMRMTVTTPHFERALEMDALTRGMDDTLIRIVSPPKERGVATLKKGTEMWNYLPKVKKSIRVPPSMMMGSWMGSDFTNDDLVRSTSWEKDYDIALAPKEAASGETCLSFAPKPDAPVTWTRVVGCFETATKLPKKVDYYDDKGRLARTLAYSDVGPLGGRTLPRRMTLSPHLADKVGNSTSIEFLQMEFGVQVSPADFSMTALQRGL